MHRTAVSAAARRCLAAGFRHRLAAPVTGLALTLALALPFAAALARSSWMLRPTGLAVSGASAQSVSLSWKPVASATGYDVYTGKANAGWTTSTTFTTTGLACGTTYRLGVDSVDGDGRQSSTTYINGSTSACGGAATDTIPPSAPANVRQTSATTTAATVTWDAATDNVGVAGYDVTVDGSTATTSATSYSMTGFQCGTSHAVTVDAFDAAGNRSATASATVATAACPDTTPPSAPASLTGQTTATSLTASWSAATDDVGVTGYDVYLDSAQEGTTQGTTYTVSNLTCGTAYTVGVEAFDAAGNHSTRASKQLTTGACSTPAPTAAGCDRYAAPTGSDSNPGTLAAPFGTAQHLADSLSPGQTGCLRGGTYDPSTTYVLNLTRGGALGAPLTIRSYPGERAVLAGIVQVKSGADTVTISDVDIRGDGTQNTVQIYAADDTIENSDITNNWLGRSCLMLGDNAGDGQAVRPVIRRNRFHECGSPANGSLDHGIYAANVSSGLITENLFWNSAAYAIQLYPNAQNTVFSHNVVDGGAPSVRGGVIFAGSSTSTSNNNTVADNVIAYSVSSNISSWWGGTAGTGNVARDNCVYGATGGNIVGGGFTSTGNVTADPSFVNRSARDYRLSAGSACLAVVGYDTAALLTSS